MSPAYSSPRHEEARVLHLLLRPAEFEEVIRCLQPILHLGMKRPESCIFSCDQLSLKRSSGVSSLFFTSAVEFCYRNLWWLWTYLILCLPTSLISIGQSLDNPSGGIMIESGTLPKEEPLHAASMYKAACDDTNVLCMRLQTEEALHAASMSACDDTNVLLVILFRRPSSVRTWCVQPP